MRKINWKSNNQGDGHPEAEKVTGQLRKVGKCAAGATCKIAVNRWTVFCRTLENRNRPLTSHIPQTADRNPGRAKANRNSLGNVERIRQRGHPVNAQYRTGHETIPSTELSSLARHQVQHGAREYEQIFPLNLL